MVLKLFGLGFKKFVVDNFNVFDGVVVIISIIDLCIGGNSGINVLRTFRLLRIFKLIKSWTTLRVLLVTVLESLATIINLGLLILLFIFIFSLLGK